MVARRAKVTVSIGEPLLLAVDRYVASHPETDRSKVFDAALQLWQAQQQDAAMAEQYAEPDDVDPTEWAAWRSIRGAAARRLIEGRAE